MKRETDVAFANHNTAEIKPKLDSTIGRKFDTGKVKYRLLSPHFIEGVGSILTSGAEKYDEDNWLIVPDARKRYTDALLRHVYDYLKGNKNDDETGKSHLLHAACNLMFLYEFDERGIE